MISANIYETEVSMKKDFISVKIEFINISASDIITTSPHWSGGNIDLPIIPFSEDDPI